MDEGKKKWILYRQDNNGAKYICHVYHTKKEADKALNDLEKRNEEHKQTYWLEEMNPDNLFG